MKDYQEYYIQGSDHYLMPKEEFEELLDRIYKAIKYINEAQLGEFVDYRPYYLIDDICGKDLLKILKGEEDE